MMMLAMQSCLRACWPLVAALRPSIFTLILALFSTSALWLWPWVAAPLAVCVCSHSQENSASQLLCSTLCHTFRSCNVPFSNCPSFTEAVLLALVKGCPALARLVLCTFCKLLQPVACFQHLGRNAHALRMLDLDASLVAESVRSAVWEAFCAGCSGLHWLSVTNAQVGTLVARCRQLQYLSLASTQLTDAALSAISRSLGISLRALFLPFCRQLTDVGVAHLADQCSGLHVFCAPIAERLTAESVKLLLSLPHLVQAVLPASVTRAYAAAAASKGGSSRLSCRLVRLADTRLPDFAPVDFCRSDPLVLPALLRDI